MPATILATLVTERERIATIPRHEIPELLGELETLRGQLLLRLTEPAPVEQGREPLLTAVEVSERTGLPLQRVYELCRREMIPHVRVGRQVRVAPSALREWIERGGAQPVAVN
jgi:excisionase family DNA binding protein